MKNIIILLLLLFSLNAKSQRLDYRITSNNSYIGNLKVTKSINENVVQIEVISEVKVKLFIHVDIKYILNCTYQNNELLYSSVTTYVNGAIHSASKTEKKGEYYTITRDGHTSKYLTKITFSGALLYYQEPKGLTEIFSEFDSVDKPIKSIGVNEYQIKNPKNGYLSEYTYKNGILESSTNHHTLLTFKLKKIK